MLLHKVRNWQGGKNVLPGCELYTDTDLDTAVAVPRDFACDVRQKVLSKKYIFLVTVMSLKMICGRCEMEDVVINLRRRHQHLQNRDWI